jgi:winged helix-turn-helix protein
LTTTGEKLTLLAEILRVSIKGATEAEISEELSLSDKQTLQYLRFLKAKRFVVHIQDGGYFPSEKGLAYLATYDAAADLVDLDEPTGYYSGAKPNAPHAEVYWDREEIAARMREIIGR